MTMQKLPTVPGPARGGGIRLLQWLLVGAFVVAAVADLICEAAGWDGWALVFRAVAMPLLIAAMLAARPPADRTIVLLVIALVFCWLGDTAGGSSFLTKIGLFLLAQWFFTSAFWPFRRGSLLRRPAGALCYAAALVILITILIRPAHDLAIPVVVYGLSLTTMAILATGLNRRAAIGGLLFMVSDALLAVNWFYRPPTGNLVDVLVMLTYLIAQALLVSGTVAAVRSRRAVDSAHRSGPDRSAS